MNSEELNRYIQCAVREIEEPSFSTTRQYLEVNSILKIDGEYVVERIRYDQPDEIVVYFKIANERYFFGVWVNKVTTRFDGVFIENGNHCYLSVRSTDYSLEELAQCTRLKHTSGYSKGAIENFGSARYKNSFLRFELLDSECYSTEDALRLLLDKLEPHKDEIAELSRKADVGISIEKFQYTSGDHELVLDIELLKRLAELNVEVWIDPYICGTPILDLES